ncbi:MAG TPA: tail fiber domain-containing protein [Candidatus Omnitrophota bacterium]|nr:tail fiber domain-containing protein [Candidatus Omnitrophota bacterium]HPD84571.1 tail fiber domain-containing protein [Candidatus Omnitrophota bacterium]HRZ03429.1 tail fiber domain-containing protein [Candidatus Omnitrophota bacterium]
MKIILSIVTAILLLAVFFSPAYAQTETMTLTTYYPAPLGFYSQLRLVPRSATLGPPVTCDNASKASSLGVMWLDGSLGVDTLKICQDDGTGTLTWTTLGSGGGGSLWTRTGSNLYPINITDNIGVGTQAPQAPLHIRNGTNPNIILEYDLNHKLELTHNGTDGVITTDTGAIRLEPNLGVSTFTEIGGTGGLMSTLLTTRGTAIQGISEQTAGAGDNTGVYGRAGGGGLTATKYGVQGIAASDDAGLKVGVYGEAGGIDGRKYGVYGRVAADDSSDKYALYARTIGGNVSANIYGLDTWAFGNAGTKYGVNASATGLGGDNYAVKGGSTSVGGTTGYGLYGSSVGAGTNYGVYATASGGSTNYAGYFAGDLAISNQPAGTHSRLFINGDGKLQITSSNSLKNRLVIGEPLASMSMANAAGMDIGTPGSPGGANAFITLGTNSTNEYGYLGWIGTNPGFEYISLLSTGGINLISRLPTSVQENRLRITNDGHIYLDTLISGAGNASIRYNTTTKEITYTPLVSSKRYKKDIANLEFDTDGLYSLRPVSFTWKESSIRDFGLIAEEVDEVLPSLVAYDAQGRPDSVAYDKLPVLLLVEMQKLRAENRALQERVEKLEAAVGAE